MVDLLQISLQTGIVGVGVVGAVGVGVGGGGGGGGGVVGVGFSVVLFLLCLVADLGWQVYCWVAGQVRAWLGCLLVIILLAFNGFHLYRFMRGRFLLQGFSLYLSAVGVYCGHPLSGCARRY